MTPSDTLTLNPNELSDVVAGQVIPPEFDLDFNPMSDQVVPLGINLEHVVTAEVTSQPELDLYYNPPLEFRMPYRHESRTDEQYERSLKWNNFISSLVVFTGSRASGKSSAMKEFQERYDGYKLPNGKPLNVVKARRYTERAPRPEDDPNEFVFITDEQLDSQYRTITRDEFDARVINQEILTYEPEDTKGKVYGYAVDNLKGKENTIVIAQCNDDSFCQDLRYLQNATVVYVTAPHDVLKERLRKRLGDEEEFQKKVATIDCVTPIEVCDENGTRHEVTYEDRYYGLQGELSGIGDIIVDNQGDIADIPGMIMQDVLDIYQAKIRVRCVAPQVRVSLSDDEIKREVLREGYVVNRAGENSDVQNMFKKGEREYQTLITLLAIKPVCAGIGERTRYALEISDFDKDVNRDQMRSGYFRAMAAIPVAYFGSKENMSSFNGGFGHDLRVEMGLSRPRMAHDEYCEPRVPDEDIHADYYEESRYIGQKRVSLRDVRDLMAKHNMDRLI